MSQKKQKQLRLKKTTTINHVLFTVVSWLPVTGDWVRGDDSKHSAIFTK